MIGEYVPSLIPSINQSIIQSINQSVSQSIVHSFIHSFMSTCVRFASLISFVHSLFVPRCVPLIRCRLFIHPFIHSFLPFNSHAFEDGLNGFNRQPSNSIKFKLKSTVKKLNQLFIALKNFKFLKSQYFSCSSQTFKELL